MGVIFMLKTEELKLVSEWDKTYPKSEKVNIQAICYISLRTKSAYVSRFTTILGSPFRTITTAGLPMRL